MTTETDVVFPAQFVLDTLHCVLLVFTLRTESCTKVYGLFTSCADFTHLTTLLHLVTQLAAAGTADMYGDFD